MSHRKTPPETAGFFRGRATGASWLFADVVSCLLE